MPDPRDALLAIAWADLRAAQAKIDTTQLAQERALNSFAKALRADNSEAPAPDTPGNAHLANHRPGLSAKIDTDPELEAFILARIHTTGFVQLATEVAEYFPPERRPCKTAINDWWNRNLRPDLT